MAKLKTYTGYELVVAAAGSSERFKSNKLKYKLNNEMVIDHSLRNFIEDKNCKKIFLMVPEKEFDFYKKKFYLVSKLVVVVGGLSRFETVRKGVSLVRHENVLIHDAARPFFSEQKLVEINHILEDNPNFLAGSLVLKSRDSVLEELHNEYSYLNREHIYLVQTPQYFKTAYLNDAYTWFDKQKTALVFNDELSLVLQFNPDLKPSLIEGSLKNIKITYLDDVE